MKTWLVQIPPGVDISKAKSLENGEFQIGKSTYTLTPAPVALGPCSALEVQEGGACKITVAPSQLMELTKSVALPKVDKSVKKDKPLVAQKTNLKARHFATGYGPSPEQEKSLELEKPSQKRQIPQDLAASTPKKSKKTDIKTPKSEKKEKKKSKTPKSEKKKKSKD